MGTEIIVLLVDDKEIVRRITEEMLISSGYEVLTADSAEMALKIAETHQKKINLLLTDCLLPKLNGFELYLKIKSMIPGMKVIFMSGYSEKEALSMTENTEEYLFIAKPFSLKSLLDIVQAASSSK